MTRIELGDVFEIETKKGKAYIQYMEHPKNKNEVEKVRVFYSLHIKRPSELKEVVEGDFFYLNFILKAAFKGKVVKRVGNIELPYNLEYPTVFRTEHIFKKKWWQIVDSKTLQRKSVETLNDEQKKISPWGIWNDTLLIEKLEEGWTLKKWS